MFHRVDSKNREELATRLAEAVIADLRRGISERDIAVLAVSGGSTPVLFFQKLALQDDIDWTKVIITLVDERWVDETSGRSNARLVRQNLLTGPAALAHFVPLFVGGTDPDPKNIARSNDFQQQIPHPYNAVVLGMGNDGHTASFFPGADALDQALTSHEFVLAIRAPGAGEPRATLTLPRLLETHSLYLHIEGAQKYQTLARAMENGPISDMPVRAVLRQNEKLLNIYWCP